MTERSELDEFAVRMESAVDRFLGDRPASTNFVQIGYAADESVGDYPQAKRDAGQKWYADEYDVVFLDRFPEFLHAPVQLKLKRSAKWTDVLSSELWTEGYLLNEKALAVFERFDLGNYKTFEAEVQRGKDVRKYAYLLHLNSVTLDDLDFENCGFYLADMLGSPKHMLEVASVGDYETKRKQATFGELEGSKKFDRLAWKTVRFRENGTPRAAIFGMGPVSRSDVYVRRELHEALRDTGVTGLEFKRNLMLFE